MIPKVKKEDRVKVGSLVKLKNRKTAKSSFWGNNITEEGLIGTVRYSDSYNNNYYVGNFFPTMPHLQLHDVKRHQMEVLSPEDYPELYL